MDDTTLKTNSDLGKKVRYHLQAAGLESTQDDGLYERPINRVKMEDCFTEILTLLGLDVKDPSLLNTPKRVTRMFCDELFIGLDYNNFPDCTLFPAMTDELVVIENIEVNSVCEHHFVPFVGTATVGYIPGKQIMGISKFNRIVDFFSRRPQVQERLTMQVSKALQFILSTDDVAVVIRAEHMCARIRGVKSFKSTTRTSSMEGRFRTVDALRSEFMSLIRSA